MRDTATKFSPLTIFLHWTVGITIIVLIGVGLYISQNSVYSLYLIHKSIGALIFLVIIWRVIWRIMNGLPKPVGHQAKALHTLANVVHIVLLLGTLMYPISGLMMSIMGGHGLSIFGLELVAENLVNGETAPLNATLAGIGSRVHNVLTPIMITAIVLHVFGALKHHFIDKDDTLRRMIGRFK